MARADDAESLARAIVTCIEDTDRLDAVAARAYRWAVDRFDWPSTGVALAQAVEDRFMARSTA